MVAPLLLNALGSNPAIPQKSFTKTAMMTVLLPGVDHKPVTHLKVAMMGCMKARMTVLLPGVDHKHDDPPEGRHDGLYEAQNDCVATCIRP